MFEKCSALDALVISARHKREWEVAAVAALVSIYNAFSVQHLLPVRSRQRLRISAYAMN